MCNIQTSWRSHETLLNQPVLSISTLWLTLSEFQCKKKPVSAALGTWHSSFEDKIIIVLEFLFFINGYNVFTIEDWFGVTDSAFDVRQSFKAVEWLEIISETSEPHRRQERPLTQSMKGKKILGLTLKKWNLSKITYYAEIGHICHLLQRK